MKNINNFINEVLRQGDKMTDEDIAGYIRMYVDDYSDDVPERGWRDLVSIILETIKERLEFHHIWAKRINPKREDIPELGDLIKVVDKCIKDLPRK